MFIEVILSNGNKVMVNTNKIDLIDSNKDGKAFLGNYDGDGIQTNESYEEIANRLAVEGKLL